MLPGGVRLEAAACTPGLLQSDHDYGFDCASDSDGGRIPACHGAARRARPDGVFGVVLHFVLVDDEDVEPDGAAVVGGAEPADALGLEGLLEALVADVAEAEDGDAGGALGEEEGLDGDVVDAVLLAEVVEEAAGAEEIQRRVLAVAAGVIVVPVYDEDGQRDVEVRILVVDTYLVWQQQISRKQHAREKEFGTTTDNVLEQSINKLLVAWCRPPPIADMSIGTIDIGASPMQYLLSICIVLTIVRREGLFS